MDNRQLISNCKQLLKAFKEGKLGQTRMPEDSKPEFNNQEERLVYFTLPMALNYQRDSYKLWESVLKTYKENKALFNIKNSAIKDINQLKKELIKHKVALQPNKQPNTWHRISNTISSNWKTITNLLESTNYDFLKLKELVQKKHKKGFPYLSGPKIFNYWCFILSKYCDIKWKNKEYIEIAPDTHITKCSIKLGVISEKENLTKHQISKRWRALLQGSSINPIEMHAPLWFWSRNGFIYNLEKNKPSANLKNL